MRNNTSWLQHIPKHWEVKRLKDLGFFYGGLSGKSGDDFQCEDENIIKPFIPYTNILNNFYVNSQVVKFVLINDNEEQNKVQKGDLLFLMSSEDYESIAKASVFCEDVDVMYLNSFCKGLRITNKNVYSPFLCYVLSNDDCRDAIRLEAQGFTRINIKTGKVASASIPLPPLSEQEKIARYLDTKVEEIDQKVSLIEKKIEHYQLLKKSIINKVVTTGLHPEAPLKDSQISWLGQIPEHWEVKRIKDIISLVFMGTSPSYEYEVENENYVFGQRNNQLYKIDFNGLKHATNEFFNSRSEYEYLTYGDVIINTLGGGSVGRVGYFDYLGDMRMITDGHVMILRSNSYSTKFLYYYLHSKRRELENLASGSTNQSFFNISDIVVLYLPAPPLSEQQEIASYLDQKCADIDAIIANCTAQIEKYKTLKRALINEVVTGQRTIE